MLKENIPEKEGVKCRVLDFNPSLNIYPVRYAGHHIIRRGQNGR